jgi:hypothetical protein
MYRILSRSQRTSLPTPHDLRNQQVLRPYQVVSIVPGCLCISRKTSLIRTLLNSFGPDVTWTIVPRTFKLPDELDEWEDWTNKHSKQVSFTVVACVGRCSLLCVQSRLAAIPGFGMPDCVAWHGFRGLKEKAAGNRSALVLQHNHAAVLQDSMPLSCSLIVH